MYRCNRCGKKFGEEPLYGFKDDTVYCSEKCFPERFEIQAYSFEYKQLVFAYREFVEHSKTIENWEERVELENDIDEVLEEYASLFLGDDESSFYKTKILEMYEKVLSLNDDIHECLRQKVWETYEAVKINWYEILEPMDTELVGHLHTDLFDALEDETFHYRNLSWASRSEDTISFENHIDLICFHSTEDQQRFYRFLRNIFESYGKNTPVTDAFEEFTTCMTVKRCPVCGCWEDIEDFVFDQDRNVNVCNQSAACSLY